MPGIVLNAGKSRETIYEPKNIIYYFITIK